MDYLEVNKNTWNKRTSIHLKSDFYDVDGFIAGNTSLREIELAELTDVKGKSMLHLQCHFGLDSLSWARKGATVTGVDLSSEAIEQATNLSNKLSIAADFICSDIYSFKLDDEQPKFDIVYTSYGALCWLPCINQWAKTVADCLKPGGLFYMVEFHPMINLFENEPYFHSTDPLITEEETYTDGGEGEVSKIYRWSHPLSEVINALTEVGLTIKILNEYPYSPYNCFDGLEEKQKGRFYKNHKGHELPLIYSIFATK